ncbi:MAG: polyphosphate polymerase domain-containing protein [Bacteroidales bacterium]|nr:polyphosphate polymerase domain-containing protein [Bacteroidales bacterium]
MNTALSDVRADLDGILSHFHTITLEDIKQVRLMSRVDQKYIIPRTMLPQLLDSLYGGYHMQSIDGEALANYHTLYFDTADLSMYTVHHNRKLNRQKLRIRCYQSTQATFFEIKNKNNKGRTNKTRIKVSPDLFYTCLQHEEVQSYLSKNSPYAIERLLPQLENEFQRITLANYGMTERVTIDLGIHFHNRQTGLDADLSPVAVIEVKSDANNPSSDIKKQLLNMRIHPKRMSKYCIGTVLTNPKAKRNRFKTKLRYIERMSQM